MGCSSIPREISLFWWSKMANHHAYIPDWKGKTKGKSLPCRDRPSESGACHFTETVHTRTWFDAAPTRVPEGIFILKSLMLGDRYWDIMKSLYHSLLLGVGIHPTGGMNMQVSMFSSFKPGLGEFLRIFLYSWEHLH